MGGGLDQPLAAPAADALTAEPIGIPSINPATGLSTDYLNHFTEAVMALEMLTVMPDCLPDLLAWKPMSYCEHFAASRFTHRNAIIDAYWAADPKLRRDIEDLADVLNASIAEALDLAVARDREPAAVQFAERAAAELKPLIARMSAIVNGTMSGSDHDRPSTQAAIDALFAS